MNAEHITIVLTITAITALAVLSVLFGLLSLAGRVLTHEDDRSALGNVLGHVYGAAGVLLLTFAGTLGLRLGVNIDGLLDLEPGWLNVVLRTTLTSSALWCMIAALYAFPKLITRFRKRPVDTYELNQAAVFGTLAKALPVIVSNHEGTIQHTTAEFDKLVGTIPGHLVGKSLTEIMPERYHAGHHHGMKRYMETREPHIMGTVVAIEMRRIDGAEVPVYLALNTTDVDGNPWYVASIWPRTITEPDALTPDLPYQEGINIRQDKREVVQNDREVGQDKRTAVLARLSNIQDQRGAVQDDRTAKQDRRDVTADARDVTADDRDTTADDRDVTACARDVTADEREARE